MNFVLFNTDCIEGMRCRIDDGSVDVVVTSPPYNIGKEYGTYSDNLSTDQYLSFMSDWMTEVSCVLSQDGSFFLNLGCVARDPFVFHEILARLRGQFYLQNTFAWVKSVSIDDDRSYGHFKPINSPRYTNRCHEWIFHLTKTGKVPLDRMAIGVPYQDKSNIARWNATGGSDMRCRGDVWYIPYNTRQTAAHHPAYFPVKLPEQCIKLHGLERAETVMDPFMGIGSTAMACQKLAVDTCIGFEIDQKFWQISADALYDRRLMRFTHDDDNVAVLSLCSAEYRTTRNRFHITKKIGT